MIFVCFGSESTKSSFRLLRAYLDQSVVEIVLAPPSGLLKEGPNENPDLTLVLEMIEYSCTVKHYHLSQVI